MSICNYINERGYPPQDCTGMQGYLGGLITVMSEANPLQCDEAANDPDNADLNALYGTCDVPQGAIVNWYNTLSATGSVWVFIGETWVQML